MTIRDRFPTAELFEKASAEEIGVELVLELQQPDPFRRFSIASYPMELAQYYGQHGVSPGVLTAWTEGVEWARRALLLIPDLGQPMQAGWMILSREGRAFTRDRLTLVRLQQIMPDYLLHPTVRAASLDIFNTGHYQSAVFEAFKAFEVATREAANLDPHSYGDGVMKDAFHYETGALRDSSQSDNERLALMNFTRGAYGLFKNPRSHRNLDLTDPSESAELLIIASHLMRIVDAARQRTGVVLPQFGTDP